MDNRNCNPTVRCSVDSCAHHTGSNCCSLGQITVGCCDCAPARAEGTECCSFTPGTPNK